MAEMKLAEVVEVKDEQAFLEKLKEESETDEKRSSEHFLTRTGIINYSRSLVYYSEIHFWEGHSPYSYPDLPVDSGVRVAQYGVLPVGVKVGLVFVDGHDSGSRRFVVAVDSPARKIYAETGSNGPVDWKAVEDKLGMAGDMTEFNDPVLGGKIVATMVDDFSLTKFYH
ncbi:hypothetical protein RND81_05G131600 [Saponaria officinalis]|uniref:Uncharacterized protein n=1 Tax=Saponaria officinalis TaxID=3572 RepID=A0AAW1KSQ2_SAPOF